MNIVEEKSEEDRRLDDSEQSTLRSPAISVNRWRLCVHKVGALLYVCIYICVYERVRAQEPRESGARRRERKKAKKGEVERGDGGGGGSRIGRRVSRSEL